MELRANHVQDLLTSIKDWLNDDERLTYVGRGANEGHWSTDGHMVDLKKNMALKGMAEVRITVFKEDEEGVELKIEMKFPSYLEWDSVFEGFVDTMEEMGLVFKMIGL